MTLKIQLLSDTHCQDYTLSPDADLIVHLGDEGNGDRMFIQEFVAKCKEIDKPYTFVAGNHSSYNSDITALYEWVDSEGINYLTDGKEFVYGGYTFIGGTLFTSFSLNTKDPWDIDVNKRAAQMNISDFHCIKLNGRLVSPEDYATMHSVQRNWIEQYRGRDDVVVLTHFAPNAACLDEYWRVHGGLLNAYFINDIPLKGFNTWAYGHTHSQMDKVVDGCRLVNNVLGYRGEVSCKGYVENLIIELPQLYRDLYEQRST